MDYVSYAAAILLSILVVVTSSTNIGYMEEYNKQNARKRLDIVINNAADSSLQDALQRLVVDSKEVNVNPELLFENFYKVFAESYGMTNISSDKTRLEIYKLLPLISYIGEDAMYVTYNEVVNGKLERRVTPAIPYVENKEAYTFAYAYEEGVKYKIDATNKLIEGQTLDTSQSSTDIRDEVIARQVTQTIRALVKDINENAKEQIALPLEFAGDSVLNIQGPSILVYAKDFNLESRKIDLFTVAGTQVQEANRVIGYTEGGRKLYSFTNWKNNKSSGTTVTANIEKIYATAEEAVKDGYQPDLERILKFKN